MELRYEVNETTSSGVVYLSESIANPNAALHDTSFNVNEVSNVAILGRNPGSKMI